MTIRSTIGCLAIAGSLLTPSCSSGASEPSWVDQYRQELTASWDDQSQSERASACVIANNNDRKELARLGTVDEFLSANVESSTSADLNLAVDVWMDVANTMCP